MKVLFAILAIFSTITLLQCQVVSKEDSGQYVPDNSGQYVHDGSGQYIHDRSGDYLHDGLGNYLNDNTGTYKGDPNGFYQKEANLRRQNGFLAPFLNNQRRNFNAEPSKQVNQIASVNLVGAGSNVNTQYVKPIKPVSVDKAFFGNVASAATPVGTGVNVKYDPGRYVDGHWKIIRQAEDIDTDGYHWEYETENGITAEESGKLANKGTDKEAMKAKGFYEYTGPDKNLYSLGYTADENGFVAVGNHLPTPPPIPIEIQRSLDYLRSVGKL